MPIDPAQHLSRSVRDVLEHLDEPERDAFLLRELGGLGYREIAERCGLSEPAAKMRVLRGLRELRARFERESDVVKGAALRGRGRAQFAA